MKPEYANWIANNVKETYGTCASVTQDMRLAFPELTRVRGHYYDWIWGEREHWWLIAPDGSIVDPTAAQFPSKGTGEYVPWDESQPEPTGRCLNCGEYTYNNDTFCSDGCGYATCAELGVTYKKS